MRWVKIGGLAWCWCTVLLAGQSVAQDEAAELFGDTMMRTYLAAEAAKLEARFFPEVRSADDFEALREKLQRQYFHMLGLWPIPEKTPLDAKVTGVLDRDDYVVEKLHYQSMPRLYVTGNLYRPKQIPDGKRLPAVLYVCGHSGRGRDGNKTAYQDHGIWLAKHGYVCLVVDTLQLGEIAAIHHGTYREERWWWHSAGYTSAGVECWNGIRGIDYLVGRRDVDAARLAVTGISGGGAATFWIAAADPRVQVAVPVSGMADLDSYVTDQVVNGHCDCMFLYNTYRWNWTNTAALICPRPLLFMNSDNDGIFPMDANERVIARLERLYAHFGAGDRVDAVVSIGGHAYRRDLRAAAFRFINTYLKGDAGTIDDPEIGLARDNPREPLIRPEELRVFAGEDDLPADELNTRIDETFVQRADVPLPERGRFGAWREQLLAQLSEQTFGAWPASIEPVQVQRGGDGWTLVSTETHVWSATKQLRPAGEDSEAIWLLVAGAGESLDGVPAWAVSFVSGAGVLLAAPRGVGPTAWTTRNPPNTIDRSLALLGCTADSGRVFDVLTLARRRAEKIDRSRSTMQLKLIGRGRAGVIAAYAALYEPRVAEVVVVDPPASHLPAEEVHDGGPHLLNVLRVLDIPDALGALAPRRLTVVSEHAAFAKTREIYRRAEAGDRLTFQCDAQ